MPHLKSPTSKCLNFDLGLTKFPVWEVEVLRVEVTIEAELGHKLRPNWGYMNHPIDLTKAPTKDNLLP
jgi:hypothetical protein